MFFREPSAMFWTFGFPVILSLALGIAFRNKPPDAVRVAVVSAPGADEVKAALGDGMKVTVEDEAAARAALRTGKASVVVVPEGTSRAYLFDDTRPESRIARLAVED